MLDIGHVFCIGRMEWKLGSFIVFVSFGAGPWSRLLGVEYRSLGHHATFLRDEFSSFYDI